MSSMHQITNICLEVRGTDANDEGWPNNDSHSYHDGEEYGDLDHDEILDDINDKGVKEGENIHPPSVEHPSRGIIIQNDPGADMLSVDPDATHALKFLEYKDIIPAHRLMAYLKMEYLFENF
ncbi:hypothetical protein PVK06_016828 [Gossypium arboreum]|uniref:Uncharacterized protein n=1 Tax=Gossypium arboreum TaxID=29729 RepID=A0ABR0Q263_GOSAR|nr:hypothetical protein PVK06_016828 [Gossypium arboreum]